MPSDTSPLRVLEFRHGGADGSGMRRASNRAADKAVSLCLEGLAARYRARRDYQGEFP
jgi:hypothetical protein